MSPQSLILGLGCALVIAALAYRRGALSFSGAMSATIVGTLIFAVGGLAWAMLLVAFFVTSSALSRYQARAKAPLAEKFQKGHRRDLGQVLANGGWGALLAMAYAFAPQPMLFVAYVGAMATVNADTWATELGVLSKTAPRLITNWRVVAVGTSGGITSLGTLVAFCGALLIGALAFLAQFIAGDYHLSFAHSPRRSPRLALRFPPGRNCAGDLLLRFRSEGNRVGDSSLRARDTFAARLALAG